MTDAFYSEHYCLIQEAICKLVCTDDLGSEFESVFEEENHKTVCRCTGWETLYYSVMGVLFVPYEL